MKHQNSAVKVVKNLKKIINLGLKLSTGKGNQITTYVDTNWGEEPGPGRRSITGSMLFYGEAPVILQILYKME